MLWLETQKPLANNGLGIRHLLQQNESLPSGLAPPLPELPQGTEALGQSWHSCKALRMQGPLTSHNGQCLIMQGLEYWNGVVLNVAHSMITFDS
jgi:hypothetical protein